MISKEIIKKIRQIQIFTKKSVTSLFSGEYESAFKGKGIEFEEVREYYPGDDVRPEYFRVLQFADPGLERYKAKPCFMECFRQDLFHIKLVNRLVSRGI